MTNRPDTVARAAARSRPLRGIRIVFHGGLFAAASALVLVIAAAIVPTEVDAGQQLRDLLRIETAIGYVVLALLHMVLLSSAVRWTAELARARGVGFLYTAGFVHTLIALGVAIAVGGAELLTTGLIDAHTVGVVLLPMGAAVLPHAIGVWVGQDIEAGLPSSSELMQEGVLGQLRTDADEAQRELQTLYDARRGLLQEEVAALQAQLELWQRMQADVAAWLNAAKGRVEDVARAAGAVEQEVRVKASLLQTTMGNVTAAASGSEQALIQLRQAIESGTAEAAPIRPVLHDLTDTIQKVEKLTTSIIELLESRIFEVTR